MYKHEHYLENMYLTTTYLAWTLDTSCNLGFFVGSGPERGVRPPQTHRTNWESVESTQVVRENLFHGKFNFIFHWWHSQGYKCCYFYFYWDRFSLGLATAASKLTSSFEYEKPLSQHNGYIIDQYLEALVRVLMVLTFVFVDHTLTGYRQMCLTCCWSPHKKKQLLSE